jgi:Fe(3+) dicitrate transport protein
MNDAHAPAATSATTVTSISKVAAVALGLAAAAASAQDQPRSDNASAAGRQEEPAVLVIGTRRNLEAIAGSGEILERELLDAAHVFTTNEALRKVPGVLARDEEGFGLRPNIGIRGLNPTRSSKVLLLEDGLPLTYAPYGDNASYYHPPIDRFERVEVLKGSGQILFGPHTVGGVINYITPSPPEELGARLALLGGNKDYREVHAEVGDTVGNTGVILNGTHKETEGARDHMQFEVTDLNFKLVQALTERQSLSLRASYYDEDSQVPYSGLTLTEYQADPRGNAFLNDDFQVYRWSSALTHEVALSDALQLTTSTYYTYFNRDWWRQSSNSSQRPNDASDPACGGMANLSNTCGNEGRLRQYSTAGFEPRLSWRSNWFGAEQHTDLGVRFHSETQFRVQANGDTPTARTPGTAPNAGISENSERDVEALSAFVQTRFAFGRFGITPGVRVEDIEYERRELLTGASGRTSTSEVIPGLGATFEPLAGTVMFAGVHRGFAPPAVADILTASGGSTELDPEQSWNYELGVRSALSGGVRVEAALFRMDFENQVIPASVAGGIGTTVTNAGETLHQGAELLAQLDSRGLFGTTYNVFLRAAYTWLEDAEFRGVRFSNVPDFSAVSVRGNRLPYAPEHLIAATLGYESPFGVQLQVEGIYNDSMFTDDLNTVAVVDNGQRGLIPSYTVWNISAQYDVPGTGLSVFTTLKNATDELYVVDMSRGLIPGMPRLVQAGFEYRF